MHESAQSALAYKCTHMYLHVCVCDIVRYLQSATGLSEACSAMMKSLTTPAYATLYRQTARVFVRTCNR